MSSFRIDIDIAHLIPPNAPIGPDIFPNLIGAIDSIADAALARWQDYASGRPLPDGAVIRARSGAYLRSIQLRTTGSFSREVYSDSPYADAIERGGPARDLKRMLDSSMKVRVSKEGKRYLIIPFRHGTPGTVGFGSVMSQSAYDAAKQLAPSRIIGRTRRPSGAGAYSVKTHKPYMVPSRVYAWGDRMSQQDLLSAGASPREASRMAGMVRFQGPRGRHGQYLTFRVMSEDSTGWVVPAQEGKHPAQTVADQIRPLAERAFSEAVRADVEHWLVS